MLVVALGIGSWAQAAAPPPIVGGQRSTAFPEVVLLYALDSNGNLAASCSGTVIADGWVLTAAHCVADDGDFQVHELYVCFVDRSSEVSASTSVLASTWVVHPAFEPTTAIHDVALVQFASANKTTMNLYDTPPSSADEGRAYTLVGFGSTGQNDYSADFDKREAEVALDSFDADFYYTYRDDQNACLGDSGGPLLRVSRATGEYALAGVMNWVTACEGGTLASARIDKQLDFIETYAAVSFSEPFSDGAGVRPADEAPGRDEFNATEPNGVACATAVPFGWSAAGGAAVLWRRRQRSTVRKG